MAELSGPGSQIRLLTGIYYETFQPELSGTSTNYYSIVGDSNPDSTIIDASDVDLLNSRNWLTYPPGGSQVNSIYYRIYSNAQNVVQTITAGWGQRLHCKQDTVPAELVNTTSYAGSPYYLPEQGYRVNGDTLLVRLEGGDNPNQTTMHVGIRPTIDIRGSFWAVRNLTARYSASSGIFVDSHNDGVIIRGCRTYNNRGAGVFFNSYADSGLIDSCAVWDGRIDSWSYLASKFRVEENSVGIFSHGHNTVVRNCTVTGTSNGIQVSANELMIKTWGADSDIYYNKVTNITDDGLENDFNQGVNVAVWGNLIRGCNNGWSQTTSDIGPTYVIYNVFDSMDSGGLKLGATPESGDSAHVFYYHNTFTSRSPFLSLGGGGLFKNQSFLNNIMVAVGAGYPHYRYIVGTDAGLVGKATFDYDLNWHADSEACADAWWMGPPGSTWDFQELRDRWGFEIHGKCGAPTYADSSARNFRPSSGDTAVSPQVDMGTRIQGINTPHKTRNGVYLYSTKPDVGAYEYNVSSPAQPPFPLVPGHDEPRMETEPPFVELAIGTPHPSPLFGMTTFPLSLPQTIVVNAGVYDVCGRLVRTIVADRVLPAGRSELAWDGRGRNGHVTPAGLYFLRVKAGTSHAVRRIMVLR